MSSQEKRVISRDLVVSMAFTSIAAGLLFIGLYGMGNDCLSCAYRIVGIIFLLFSLLLIFISMNSAWLNVKWVQQTILFGSPSIQIITLALLLIRWVDTLGKIYTSELLFVIIYFATLVFIILYLISCGISVFKKNK